MSQPDVRLYRWDDMPKESVTDAISRRMISGDRAMLSQIFLEKGSVVPTHQHENEQFSYLLAGSLRFWIGDDGEREMVLHEGEVLHIPSNVPHKAEALEDTLSFDVFSPPRQDWLDGTDTYFRQQ